MIKVENPYEVLLADATSSKDDIVRGYGVAGYRALCEGRRMRTRAVDALELQAENEMTSYKKGAVTDGDLNDDTGHALQAALDVIHAAYGDIA